MSTKYSNADLYAAVFDVCMPFPGKPDLARKISVWRELLDEWKMAFTRESFMLRLDEGYDAISNTYYIHPADERWILMFLKEEEELVKKMHYAAKCIQTNFKAFKNKK